MFLYLIHSYSVILVGSNFYGTLTKLSICSSAAHEFIVCRKETVDGKTSNGTIDVTIRSRRCPIIILSGAFFPLSVTVILLHYVESRFSL